MFTVVTNVSDRSDYMSKNDQTKRRVHRRVDGGTPASNGFLPQQMILHPTNGRERYNIMFLLELQLFSNIVTTNNV
jgi:hypothetical protein